MKTILLILKEIKHMWRNQKNIFIAIILMFFASTYGTLFLYNGYLEFEEIEKNGIDFEGYDYEYICKIKDVESLKDTLFEINDKFNLRDIAAFEYSEEYDYKELYGIRNVENYTERDSAVISIKGTYPTGEDKSNQIVLDQKNMSKYKIGDKYKVGDKEYTVCGYNNYDVKEFYMSELKLDKKKPVCISVYFSLGEENIKKDEIGQILKNDPNIYKLKIPKDDYDSFVEESELYLAEERQWRYDYMTLLMGLVLINIVCALIVLMYTNKKRYDLLWMLGLKKNTLAKLNILPVFIYSVLGYILGVVAFCASKPIFSIFIMKHYIDFQSITTKKVLSLIGGNFVWYEMAIIIVEIILMLVILRRKRGSIK